MNTYEFPVNTREGISHIYIPCANSPCFPAPRESATRRYCRRLRPSLATPRERNPRVLPDSGSLAQTMPVRGHKEIEGALGSSPATRLLTQHLCLSCALALDAPRNCAAPRARRAAPPHRRRWAARAPTRPAYGVTPAASAGRAAAQAALGRSWHAGMRLPAGRRLSLAREPATGGAANANVFPEPPEPPESSNSRRLCIA